MYQSTQGIYEVSSEIPIAEDIVAKIQAKEDEKYDECDYDSDMM